MWDLSYSVRTCEWVTFFHAVYKRSNASRAATYSYDWTSNNSNRDLLHKQFIKLILNFFESITTFHHYSLSQVFLWNPKCRPELRNLADNLAETVSVQDTSFRMLETYRINKHSSTSSDDVKVWIKILIFDADFFMIGQFWYGSVFFSCFSLSAFS